jgi:sterol 3beta-glucosyltransferase
MRIVIVTAGSRGDVAPYTGLGQSLQRAGHDVAIAAHGLFDGLVRDSGLECRTLPGDPLELTRARSAASSPEMGRAIFSEFLFELGTSLVDVVGAGTDLLLTAFGPAPLSRVVAEGFDIPSIGAYLIPAVPTGDFALPGWSEGDLGRSANRAAGEQQLSIAAALYADILPQLRHRLGLAPAAAGFRLTGPPGWPICHGFSPSVLPRPSDWPGEVRVSGYWWPATPARWEPPTELVSFLDAGPAPVFVGFGSMAGLDIEWLSDVVVAAVRRAGVRAVVQSGWAGLVPEDDDILPVGEVPHQWLLPRCAAAVHHAGAGTTGAVICAGIPSVTVPVLLDQPFWANRVHQLGVAPAPLRMAELAQRPLADAIRRSIDHPPYRQRATRLARRVRAEDGAADVLSLVAGSR